mmetsp:Transcript_59545/g.194257  ORF Transcript_59545/g.194257 Transcript_59545/m.194257 type:complete len:214 (-) Transcript_59545:1313-1954(-)
MRTACDVVERRLRAVHPGGVLRGVRHDPNVARVLQSKCLQLRQHRTDEECLPDATPREYSFVRHRNVVVRVNDHPPETTFLFRLSLQLHALQHSFEGDVRVEVGTADDNTFVEPLHRVVCVVRHRGLLRGRRLLYIRRVRRSKLVRDPFLCLLFDELCDDGSEHRLELKQQEALALVKSGQLQHQRDEPLGLAAARRPCNHGQLATDWPVKLI